MFTNDKKELFIYFISSLSLSTFIINDKGYIFHNLWCVYKDYMHFLPIQ